MPFVKEVRQIVSLGDSRIQRVYTGPYSILSMVLQYSQLHKK